MEKRGESAAVLNERMDKIEENSEQVTNETVNKNKNLHKRNIPKSRFTHASPQKKIYYF
jgi:hypothetical protein